MKQFTFAIALLGSVCTGAAQTSVITSVLDTLSQPRLAPGGAAEIFGSFPPSGKSAFSVTVGGLPAYIGTVAIDVKLNHAFEIDIQVPTEISPGVANLAISFNGAVIANTSVSISAVDPVLGLDAFTAFLHTAGVAVSPSAPASPGETVTAFMNGLGATTMLVPTGTNVSDFVPTASAVTVTVHGASAQVIFAGRYPINPPFLALDYQVSFMVPASTPTGPNDVTVTVGGVTSNTQTLYVGTSALPSPPVVKSVVSGASFSASTLIAPGSFVSIFGTGFGAGDNLASFPSTQVNGISVLFNGEPAPIFSLISSVGQINVLAPADLPVTGETVHGVAVTVQNQNGPAKALFIATAPAGPAIFLVPDPSSSTRRNVAALLANTAWYVMPVSQAQALGLSSCTGVAVTARCGQPAKRGDFIQLYATGLGTATPNGDPNGTPLGTGKVAPVTGPVYNTLALPVVTVGGQPATVAFSGIAPGFAGLYQVNFQIPQNAPSGDSVPVTLTMPGSSTDSATLAVQ